MKVKTNYHQECEPQDPLSSISSCLNIALIMICAFPINNDFCFQNRKAPSNEGNRIRLAGPQFGQICPSYQIYFPPAPAPAASHQICIRDRDLTLIRSGLRIEICSTFGLTM